MDGFETKLQFQYLYEHVARLFFLSHPYVVPPDTQTIQPQAQALPSSAPQAPVLTATATSVTVALYQPTAIQLSSSSHTGWRTLVGRPSDPRAIFREMTWIQKNTWQFLNYWLISYMFLKNLLE